MWSVSFLRGLSLSNACKSVKNPGCLVSIAVKIGKLNIESFSSVDLFSSIDKKPKCNRNLPRTSSELSVSAQANFSAKFWFSSNWPSYELALLPIFWKTESIVGIDNTWLNAVRVEFLLNILSHWHIVHWNWTTRIWCVIFSTWFTTRQMSQLHYPCITSKWTTKKHWKVAKNEFCQLLNEFQLNLHVIVGCGSLSFSNGSSNNAKMIEFSVTK